MNTSQCPQHFTIEHLDPHLNIHKVPGSALHRRPAVMIEVFHRFHHFIQTHLKYFKTGNDLFHSQTF